MNMPLRALALVLAIQCSVGGDSALAQTELEEIRIFSDVGALVRDNDTTAFVGSDTTLFLVFPDSNTGTNVSGEMVQMPGNNHEIDAYYHGPVANAVYSLDVAVEFDGQLIQPGDVFYVDFNGVTMFFDASAAGLPDSVNTDAVSYDPATDDILLSFSNPFEIGGNIYLPGDVVRYDGANFDLFFDSEIIGPGVNLDGLHVLDTGQILMSFDADVRIDGQLYHDDDIIEHNPNSGAFVLNYGVRQQHSSWVAADVNALAATRRPMGGEVSFTQAQINILENEGPLQLTVSRSGGSEGAAAFVWQTVAGTADATDYTAGLSVVTFADGDTSDKTITIPINNDNLAEGIERFSVTLSLNSGFARVGRHGRIEVDILDDETFVFADSFE